MNFHAIVSFPLFYYNNLADWICGKGKKKYEIDLENNHLRFRVQKKPPLKFKCTKTSQKRRIEIFQKRNIAIAMTFISFVDTTNTVR